MTPWQITRLLFLVIVSAWFTVRIFQGFDEAIGEGYWVVDRTQGEEGWYALGLLPHLTSIPREVVRSRNTDADPSNDCLIYAQQGDFAGNDVYGITFGIPLIMFLIWYAFIIGYPDRVDPYRLPRRIFTIVVIITCSVVVNLFLLRFSAGLLEDPMGRVAAGSAYPASLLFHNAGIWFGLLFHSLGAHRPAHAVHLRSGVGAWEMRTKEEFVWLLVLLAVVTLVELVMVQNRLALPDAASGYALWVTCVVLFVRMFGFSPRSWVWKMKGIGITLAGTSATLLIFCIIERMTGTLGAGFASPILARSFGPEYANIGFSLMLSIYLIFWMTLVAAAGLHHPRHSLIRR